MSLRRRILKWGAIGLLVVLFALWFGFTTFFFNPLEDDYEYDVSTLVPRNVDFYLSKADLGRDLDSDLELAIREDLEASQRYQALKKVPLFADLVGRIDAEAIRAEVRAGLAGLPVQVNPLTVFGGRDLAVAGYFDQGAAGGMRWAAYGRTNWMGKLGVALLGYPGLIDLEGQGMTVEEVADPEAKEQGRIAYLLRGGQLQEPLYVHRLLDVIVVGNDLALFQALPSLARQRGQDSFCLSARYEDHINKTDRSGDELELFLDYRALAEARGYTGRWPDLKAEEFAPAFAARFFQTGSINDVIGKVTFGRVLGLEMHATLSSELLTPVQKKLYRQRGLAKETILRDVASLVPPDAGLFACGVGDVGDLLREALKSAEDALVTNLEDLVRSVWSYADAHPLIDDLDAAFADRFAFCMVDHDYQPKADDPPPDGVVVPAWALVLWVEDEGRVRGLRETVQANQGSFLIQGLEPGTPGVFFHKVSGGAQLYEYFSPMISGTGMIAEVVDTTTGGATLIVSNHWALVEEMLLVHRQGEANGYPQLAELSTFRTQLNAGLASPSLVLWLNPRAMDKTLRGMAERWAADKVQIDWSIERPRIEQKVVKERMPGATWGSLTPDQETQLEMLVQPELDAFEAQFRGQHTARFKRDILQRIEAAQGVEALLLEIGLDKSDLDVALRVKYPVE